MKRWTLALCAAVMMLASTALAEYKPEYDVYVKVDAPLITSVSDAVALYELGLILFEYQEGAHAALTDSTGVEVDHYYLWICVGRDCVPVDPFTVNR